MDAEGERSVAAALSDNSHDSNSKKTPETGLRRFGR